MSESLRAPKFMVVSPWKGLFQVRPEIQIGRVAGPLQKVNSAGRMTAMTIPTKTLAVRLFEYGGPEKLVFGEYDLPPLGERDVLVKNHAGSVSRWDVKYRAGDLARYQIPGRAAFPLPQQLGREAAGEVVAAGRAVTRFKPGDRVIGVTHPEDPDSVETARGLGNLSRNLAIPGHQAIGSYAQYLVRDERMWLPLPDGVDFEQAGVALWPFSSSHRVVRDRLKVRPGDNVLVTGASGGMGQATHATGEARRRPRHRHDAARRQGRDAARARRRRRGRHRRRGRRRPRRCRS